MPDSGRRAYEYYQDDLHQQASMVHSSYGVGLHNGRKQGLAEGLQQGLHEAQLRIARSLLDVISDDRSLAEKTGLSVADVQQLRASA